MKNNSKPPFWALVDQATVSATRLLIAVIVGKYGSEAKLGLSAAEFGVLVTIVGLRESFITTPYTCCATRRWLFAHLRIRIATLRDGLFSAVTLALLLGLDWFDTVSDLYALLITGLASAVIFVCDFPFRRSFNLCSERGCVPSLPKNSVLANGQLARTC